MPVLRKAPNVGCKRKRPRIMNSLQKILSTFFPKYKNRQLRNDQFMLLSTIVSALPEDFQEIKDQLHLEDFLGLSNGTVIPEFKSFIGYYSDTLAKFKKSGQNFKVSGLKIYSKRNGKFEDIELLVRDNLLAGLKITNSQYELKEFDLGKITSRDVVKSEVIFPPNKTDIFYNSLDQGIKNILNPNDLSDIDFNNRTFYSFYDMEDGNYLAVDKNLIVYSLVHDARPMATKMKISFLEILTTIKDNQFDKEAHLDQRYKNSK